ncbi:intraflagellar transport protein 172 [Echinococcus multilocularis]|uniref:Intraflagellar transport protein 172 n=1 Tax=Echinococcus multilocularis TaxID=6211 RepID=A0A068Y1W4_ECHMU|nr:intraflagellar transport protein 172 [Echinococcus multilocularis]
MHLKHFKTLIPYQPVESKISALAWSPNSKRLAVSTSDRLIVLFDEDGERRERFSTKPADGKSKKGYVVTGLSFSFDSTKLAIAQSDNMVFVYKLGESWEDKKAICNKFPQRNPVTCIIWPSEHQIIMGLMDGKVRLANTKNNKSLTIFNSGSYVVSLAASPIGRGFISGHADGKIARYNFDDDGNCVLQAKVATHPVPPFALTWAGNSIFAAGFDRRVVIYGRDGKARQHFDYSKDPTEKESTVAVSGPGGHVVAIGSYNKIRVYNFSIRKNVWEEFPPKVIRNLYTITAMCWKADGSKLTIGTLCGGVDQFDCCMKRKILRYFEFVYVGPSQIIVLNKQTQDKTLLRSNYGYEIEDVNVMGGDSYLIAQTSDTLILAHIPTKELSEVHWKKNGTKYKILFSSRKFCVIFGAGELFVIEYGLSEVLGSVRTEVTNPYLFSVRINERSRNNAACKKIAYMLDAKTVNVMDLITGLTIGHYAHDVCLDWLELSEKGNHLLLRDRKRQLILLNTETFTPFVLLPFCSFVQWISQSDAIVAQSKDSISVWYNIDAIDRVTTLPLQGGDIVSVDRIGGKTEILVSKGMTTIRHPLDNSLIEFGTAMEDNDLERAVTFLDSLEMAEETESMWKKLAEKALQALNLLVAERCYAALGLLSKAQYLRVTRDIAEQEGDLNHYKVQTRLYILAGDLELAEAIFLEHNAVDEAINMYTEMHRYEKALEIAEAKNWPKLEMLREDYHKWLAETGQTEVLGDFRARDGDNATAVSLYLRASVPGKAAALALSDASLSEDRVILEQIAQALVRANQQEKAGELYKRLRQYEAAMRCYRAGGAFQKALDVAREHLPSEVVWLEEEWGNHLVAHRQLDAAINHFIEAGAYIKALEAATKAGEWTKAAEILSSIETGGSMDSMTAAAVGSYRLELARYYSRTRQFTLAEKAFVAAGAPNLAIEMYTDAGMWEEAHSLASTSMQQDALTAMYMQQAETLEYSGKLKEAERLYLTVKRVDRAITMYKNQRQHREVARLVRAHKPELLEQTLIRIAQELECEGNLRQAEQYYMEAGEWKSAVNMYRTRDLWEEAFRVAGECRQQPELRKQVAFLWAKHLGSDSAVRLLNRLGLLHTAIDYATEHCAFEFAFDLARSCPAEKVGEVHSKYAMFLEDEGKLSEAEEEFIKAGRPREAVLMYVHNQDWASAARVARDHDPESVNDVLLGQARIAFSERDLAQAEALLLRAQRPDMAVRAYRETGHWEDAIRVAQAYLPSKLQELLEEYEEEKMRTDSTAATTGSVCGGGGGDPHWSAQRGANSIGARRSHGLATCAQSSGSTYPLIVTARQLEASGEYLKAVEHYLKVTPDLLSETEGGGGEGESAATLAHSVETCENLWVHAANLATKFLTPENSAQVTELVATRLARLQRYSTAGELLLSIDRFEDAVNVFVAGEEWEKARKIAKDLEPQLKSYVESKYKESLKNRGQAEELAGVDVLSAIEMYAEQGRWEKCIGAAERLYQETHAERDYQLLHKYLATYAATLIKEKRAYDALLLYKRHGAPPYVQNFNIYKGIFQEITAQRNLATADAYPTWAALRDTLLDLYQRVSSLSGAVKIQPSVVSIFERMFLVAHYYATRSALIAAKLFDLATKVSISLLRDSDIIPADKAFFEAGMQCRKLGWDSMAFVFLNRFLDLMEIIEDHDGNSDALDSTDFQNTDIPLEVPIPEKPYATSAEHESVREWILAVSMDQKLDQILPKDERGIYVACLRSSATGVSALPCVVTGYPVLRDGVSFSSKSGRHSANLEDWKRLTYAATVNRNAECVDVFEFIRKWCGSVI